MSNSYYEKVGNDVKKIAVPFNIPDSWIWCRIGSYVPVITDYVASGSFASLNENVKYYQSPNYAILVRTCDFKTNFSSSLVWTDKHGYEFLSNSNLFGGELILSNIGASIGKVFIVPKLPYRMTLAPNSIMVKATNDELNKYLLFVFQSAYGQNLLKSISFSSAQAKFNKTDFRKQLIPVPPLNEQIKLMHHLESLFLTVSNIAKYYNDITILAEQLKNKILDSFFGENSRYKSYYENDLKLGEILEYEQPAKYIVNSTDYSDDFATPVLTPGKTFILGYTDEKDGIYKVNGSKVIIFDDFTTASRLVDFDFKVKSSAMKILTVSDNNTFDIEYFYYYLQTIHVNNTTHKRYWISLFSNIKIGVPPIEIQKEIVIKIKEAFSTINDIEQP